MRAIDSEIKNLIFDLGGVIINLAPDKTVEAFAQLVGWPMQRVMECYQGRPEFHLYEKGRMTDAAFRDALRSMFASQATDAALDACWNAMLLDIPRERLDLLRQLRPNHRLFLLSNTNQIHLNCFNKIVEEGTGVAGLEPFFDGTYYSHVIKMRKPDREIYEFVLQQQSLQPHETLFLDDNHANLVGAQEVGIRTFHVQHPDLIFSLFR